VASRRIGDLIRSLFAQRDDDADALSSDAIRPPSAPTNRPPSWLVQHLVTLVACVLVALLLLTAFPISGGVGHGEQALAATKQFLEPAPFVLIVVMIAVIAAAELAWRTMTVEQASLYLRSTQVSLLHSDLSMIVRGRLRYRRRQKQIPKPKVGAEKS
jgi:hypothetical protein